MYIHYYEHTGMYIHIDGHVYTHIYRHVLYTDIRTYIYTQTDKREREGIDGHVYAHTSIYTHIFKPFLDISKFSVIDDC